MKLEHPNRALALAAVGVGLLVALLDLGGTNPRPPRWAELVEQEGDHIHPRELANLMLAQPAHVVVVDVRPASEFAAWHLVGSSNLTVPQLLGAEGKALLKKAAKTRVVLVSNGMVHPGQAWVELTQRGHDKVRVLEGGLAEFKREVLTPPSLRGPVSEDRAREELPRFRAAQAFFLGAGSGAHFGQR